MGTEYIQVVVVNIWLDMVMVWGDYEVTRHVSCATVLVCGRCVFLTDFNWTSA